MVWSCDFFFFKKIAYVPVPFGAGAWPALSPEFRGECWGHGRGAGRQAPGGGGRLFTHLQGHSGRQEHCWARQRMEAGEAACCLPPGLANRRAGAGRPRLSQ